MIFLYKNQVPHVDQELEEVCQNLLVGAQPDFMIMDPQLLAYNVTSNVVHVLVPPQIVKI